MAEEIVFYTNPQSRGRIVHWMLEETGAPYRMELLSFEKNEHKAPAYLAINPMGKVPAIVHRGVVVTEVAAILTYLADAFPKAGLAPKLDDPARGTYLRWMFFGAGCLEPALIDRMLDRPVPERTAALAYGSYDDDVECARARRNAGSVRARRALQRGGRLLLRADRLGHADEDAGTAAVIASVFGALHRAAGVQSVQWAGRRAQLLEAAVAPERGR